MEGIVKAVCTSEIKGVEKRNVGSAELIENFGLKGDAHAGNWHRQVSLLSDKKIREFRKLGLDVAYGAFGENLVVDDLDFRTLPVGTRLCVGGVILEITQIGKECHSDCAIKKAVGKCIMPTEGVFARVIVGGTVSVGNHMTVVSNT